MPTSVLKDVISTETQSEVKQQYLFVLQLHNGKIVIGKDSNVARRIASINSGLSPYLKEVHQVNRILGVKPVTAERTLFSTVSKFCERYGADRIITV
jgi:hypothetical protein